MLLNREADKTISHSNPDLLVTMIKNKEVIFALFFLKAAFLDSL